MKATVRIILLILLPVTLTSFYAEPLQRGFNCNDDSIRKPFIKLQVGVRPLLYCSIGLPISIVIIGECFFANKNNKKSQISQNIRSFIFGCLANFLLCMVIKNLFGRLRPHAIQFCNANHYCPNELIDNYVESFVCDNKEHPHLARNARHSFYSGHASIPVYSAVFILQYLHAKFLSKNCYSNKRKKCLVLLVYITIFTLSLYPGFTQWYNYWHFASDVISGYIVGSVVAIFIFRFFNCDNSESEEII